MLVIGLDLGRKSRHEAVVLDDMQKHVFSRKVASSTEDLQRLLTAAWKHNCGGEIHVVMEATGMSWLVPTGSSETPAVGSIG